MCAARIMLTNKAVACSQAPLPDGWLLCPETLPDTVTQEPPGPCLRMKNQPGAGPDGTQPTRAF